ncbi:MAG TPA: sugar phosphate isomerase/epimerase family protein [Planctomycetota bacterium]|nr:sugar phosphate isomerase/epimerase family protein [Planctomycetota bacterium]
MLAFGYNTNGFAHHDLVDCFDVLADLGYEGVALSLDAHHLNPFKSSAADVARIAAELRKRKLRVCVETGTRFLLDPRRKHEPTLLSTEGRERRLDFLFRCVDIAADLGAEAVAVFSGSMFPQGVRATALGPGSAAVGAPALADAWKRLAEGVSALLDRAAARGGVAIGFEPEPGMFVDKLSRYDRLVELVGERLMLTLDLGHVRCTERVSIAEAVKQYAPRIVNAHVEDIKGTQHLHLPFGEGDIDFPPALAALEAVGYRGLVHVELSRNSHDAPDQARRSIEFLRKASRECQRSPASRRP